MNQTEITWLGLLTDREKEIYTEAFWNGVGASDGLKGQINGCIVNWRNDQNNSTAARHPQAKGTSRNDLV